MKPSLIPLWFLLRLLLYCYFQPFLYLHSVLQTKVIVNALVLINIVAVRWAQLVSTGMGDYLQAGKPSRYVISHTGQLSLAILPWVGTEER